MPRGPPAGFYLGSIVVVFVFYVIWIRGHYNNPHGSQQYLGTNPDTPHLWLPGKGSNLAKDVGDVIMPKLGNETVKADLGRAAWKLLHTTMARFPEKPTADESKALKDYIKLFARLYPCGECAEHFQQIIAKYPPQTSSRNVAAGWACLVHNEVNVSKGKPVFDCSNLGDFYDCGCADDEEKATSKAGEHGQKGAGGLEQVEIRKEGLTKGG